MKLRTTRAIAEAGEPTQVRSENYIADIEPTPGAKDGGWRVMLYKLGAFDEPPRFVSQCPVRCATEVDAIARARRVIRSLERKKA